MAPRTDPDSSANLPRRAAAHLDLAWRELSRDRGAVITPASLVLVTGEPHPLGNVAIFNDASDVAASAAALKPLLATDVPAAAIFTAAAPPDFQQHLRNVGFTAVDAMPAMAVRIDQLPATALPPGCEWLRVTADDAPHVTRVLREGFDLPQALALRFSPETLGVDPAPDATMQYFALRSGGRFIATSSLFLADGLAGIYSVATLPEERRRGLGAYATAQALRVARELGYRVGVLQSSPAGHAVYRALGFEDVAQLPMFMRVPAPAAASEAA